MPDSNRYTTLSIRKGLKDDLERLKDSSETYGDVLQRAIASEREVRDEVDHRLSHLATVQQQQSRLLVRMAVEMGVEKEQIPKNLAEYEAWGSDSPFEPPSEDTVDVYSDEKQAEFDEYAEVLNERSDRGEYEREGDLPPRRRVSEDELKDNNGGEN